VQADRDHAPTQPCRPITCPICECLPAAGEDRLKLRRPDWSARRFPMDRRGRKQKAGSPLHRPQVMWPRRIKVHTRP
jgi:hypothetical protein